MIPPAEAFGVIPVDLEAWAAACKGKAPPGNRPAYARGGGLADRGLAAMRPPPEASIEDIRAAAEAMTNPDCDPQGRALGWDDFNTVCMAFYAASGGSPEGKEALRCWSRKNKKHRDEEIDERWQHFARSPPSAVSYGTLAFRAQQSQPGWVQPSRAAEEAEPAEEVVEEDAASQGPDPFGEAKTEEKANGHSSFESIFPDNKEFGPSNPLIRLNEKHAAIADLGGKCLVMSWVNSKVDPLIKVPSFQTFKSFGERYANQYIKVKVEKKGELVEEFKQSGAYWLKWPKRRSFEGIDLVPGGEPVLPGNILNLWTGFGVVPAPLRDQDGRERPGAGWTLMQRHILEVLAGGDKAGAAYIARFAAWAVQHPGERAEVALVFRGGKGSGKGTFANAVVRIFGQHGLQIYNSKHLVGNFNGHLRNCILLFADEAFWAGDKAGESVLKGMLTEPKLVIEQKGVDATPWRNMMHVIMAANAEWVVPSSHDERRFAMFDVADCRTGDAGYFDALHREIASGGLEAMLHDLLKVELGDWHPRKIIRNEALRQQKIRSMDPRWEWWEEKLQDGVLPHGVAPDQARASALFEDFKDTAGTWRGANQTALGRFLREVGAFSLHTESGNIWRFPELKIARLGFEQRYGNWIWRNDLAAWLDRACQKGQNPSSRQEAFRT